MQIQYMFRKPKFPLLLDIDGYLVGARSGQSLLKKLSCLDLRDDGVYSVIDRTGEGWSLYKGRVTGRMRVEG